MPLILLQTFIKAPVEVVFDLSRSVALHKASMRHHKEEIIDGIRSGLMNKGDTVTWKARHLFIDRKLKVKLTQLQSPTFFADEMMEGAFKTIRHEHSFESVTNGTLMIDKFSFQSPFGIIGKAVNVLFLTAYMTRLLRERNAEIKRIAEGNSYKQFLT